VGKRLEGEELKLVTARAHFRVGTRDGRGKNFRVSTLVSLQSMKIPSGAKSSAHFDVENKGWLPNNSIQVWKKKRRSVLKNPVT